MAAAAKKSRKWFLVAIIVVVAAVVLLIPPLLAGGFTVKVSTVTFKTITGSLYYSVPPQVSTSVMTSYQYYLTVKTGGLVRTDEGNTSTTRGTANVTMKLSLMTPSNQTIDLGTFRFSGGMGTRNHTIYLSFENGLQAPGSYSLTMTLTGDVKPAGGLLQLGLSTYFTLGWQVS